MHVICSEQAFLNNSKNKNLPITTTPPSSQAHPTDRNRSVVWFQHLRTSSRRGAANDLRLGLLRKSYIGRNRRNGRKSKSWRNEKMEYFLSFCLPKPYLP